MFLIFFMWGEWLCAYALCTHRGHKREPEWLEEELQVVVNHQIWVSGTRFWPYAVTTNTGEPALSRHTKFYYNSITGVYIPTVYNKKISKFLIDIQDHNQDAKN